ncbi:Carnitinyl-CoA dehydratase [Roseovarius tolerans]|uniref:Carnitinyl-CoA dehydratase n=1 Tax=Roseovarius tolerans TaxID=74031 RepID=A0A0L6CR14_9RHOB|nr:enoyl-CoA hydratase/isomerase family protein [Roseovarius tolerans]KNX40219.1 Carnitinyl-CoA dehydratase [Roseovarius tolerans]
MIRLDKDGGLWIATLDRPDKANALTEAMLSELAGIAEAAASEAQVFTLTGAGKVFSAGADLEAARAGLATSPVWERLSTAIAAFPGLSIAALNGTVAGGAMGMVLACDIRIAAPGSKAFYPVMKLGFLPQPSDPARLTALIGPARARMILMAGQKIDTETALAWGLFDHITPDTETVLDTARALAADALAADPAHVAGIKALCRP